MPDLFVPLDTSMNSQFFTDLLRKNILNDYTISYSDDHRSELKKKFADAYAFRDGFVVDDKIMNEIYAAGEKEGIKKDTAGINASERYIRLLVKAQIARNLWDTNAFYVIYNDVNNALQKAIQSIKDNTFERMKIAAK